MRPMKSSPWTRRQLLLNAAAMGMASLAGPFASASTARRQAAAAAAGTLTIGGDLVVNRMGFGAMRLTGPGIWGEPKDAVEARRVCAEQWNSELTSSTPPMPTDPK